MIDMDKKVALNIERYVKNNIVTEIDNKGFFLLNIAETDRQDLFNFALALGLRENKATPLKTSESFVRTERLSDQQKCRYYAIYFDKVISKGEASIDSIADLNVVLKLVEEYANTGFYLIKKYKEEFDDESFRLKLLNEMDNLLANWQNNNKEKILIVQEVTEDQKYIFFLPLYSLSAACGYFDGEESELPEVEGWVDVSGERITPNKHMFAIHAKGNSMLPRIKDNDICVFEQCLPNNVSAIVGEIVLTQQSEDDQDYGCHYTIKKYNEEKKTDEEGRFICKKVELIPLNKDFETIMLTESSDVKYRTIGVLKCVVGEKNNGF